MRTCRLDKQWLLHWMSRFDCRCSRMSVDIDYLILINWLEYVGSIQQNGNCAEQSDPEEQIQLKSIDHHGHVLPVFSYLSAMERIFTFWKLKTKLTWMYWSSLRRCSEMKSMASAARYASGDMKYKSKLSLSRISSSIDVGTVPTFSLAMLQLGWCIAIGTGSTFTAVGLAPEWKEQRLQTVWNGPSYREWSHNWANRWDGLRWTYCKCCCFCCSFGDDNRCASPACPSSIAISFSWAVSWTKVLEGIWEKQCEPSSAFCVYVVHGSSSWWQWPWPVWICSSLWTWTTSIWLSEEALMKWEAISWTPTTKTQPTTAEWKCPK